MALDVLVLLFPLVLAIHNYDEYSRHEEFIRVYHPRVPAELNTRSTFFWAATTLTVFAAAVCWGALFSKNPTLLTFAKASIFALMFNAITHCALYFRRRRLLPGTLSACLLVLPYSLVAVTVMRTQGGDSPANLVWYALLGAVTLPIAIGLFLLIGYGVASVLAPTGIR